MPGFKPMGRMGRALGAPKRLSAAVVAGVLFASSTVYGVGSPLGFTDPGTYNFTVPSGVTLLRAKMWGAPGAAISYQGGPGGYVEVDIPVTPGEVLTIILPSAGNGTTAGSPGGGTGGYIGGAGGGFAAIKRGSTFLAIAPGGGGGSDGARGGPGGYVGGDGVSVIGGLTATKNGKGGTQTAGGLDGDGAGPTATQYQGANYAGGGAGGGGYYGGGSGVLLTNTGRGAGGGGSAFTHPTLVTPRFVLRGDTDPPQMDDPNYGGNAGRPGLGYGRIVILY